LAFIIFSLAFDPHLRINLIIDSNLLYKQNWGTMKKFIYDSSIHPNKNTAEIKHYLDQLQIELQSNFTPSLREEFIRDARVYQLQELDLFDFVQNFLEKQKQKNELLQCPPKVNKNLTLFLWQHFDERLTAQKSSFEKIANKPSGISPGYIAIRPANPSGSKFMIKTALKVLNCPPILVKKHPISGITIINDLSEDRRSLVNEYITDILYQRTLYDRTPVITIVTDNSITANEIALRSRFLVDFQTVSEFTAPGIQTRVGIHCLQLERVIGAEKVFAAMLIWGEHDMHACNIGVMRINHELFFSKIDHGHSACQFFTNPNLALKYFAYAYNEHDYQDCILLNVDKFKEMIDQITLVDAEIETLVKIRVYELKRAGFDINGLQLKFWEDTDELIYEDFKCINFTDFDSLEQFFISRFKKQIEVARKISNILDFFRNSFYQFHIVNSGY